MSWQHTPGPWSVGMLSGRYAAYELLEAAKRARDRALGKDESGAGNNSELQANARLIAASPDLLEALEEARNGLLWYMDRNPSQSDGSDDEAMGRIDAALAKATGDAS